MKDVIITNLCSMVIFGLLGMAALIGVCVGATHQLFVASISFLMTYVSYVDNHYSRSIKELIPLWNRARRIKYSKK